MADKEILGKFFDLCNKGEVNPYSSYGRSIFIICFGYEALGEYEAARQEEAGGNGENLPPSDIMSDISK